MQNFLKPIVLGIACFALGVAATRYYDSRRLTTARVLETAKPAAESPPRPDKAETDFEALNYSEEPLWAYGFDTVRAPGEKAQPQNPPNRNLRPDQDPEEQTKPRHIEGSTAAFSLVDIRDGQNVIDWFPNDHPLPMPNVVAHGPVALGKTTRGCGSCHLPNGKGRPENAGIAGLPPAYFLRQIQDFRSGRRRSADPRKPNTNTMIELAKSLSDEELKAAAAYFGSLKWTPWIRVVETDRVPKTRIVGNLFLPLEQQQTEPIAGRIIEMPQDEEQAETYRNPHSGFVAYVPTGSLTKGKDLVTTGGARIVGKEFIRGKTTPCITCHGPDLMGVADIPPIAGRSPSYIVRQMWDMKQGTRNSEAAQLMRLVLADLTREDMVAIAAYVSSRTPVDVTSTPQVTAALH